jgi:molybdate transport system regulatory protein
MLDVDSKAAMKTSRKSFVLRPRWRVLIGRDVVLGPGKADLLEAVVRTGSLRLSARHLDMSYMRAWKLVQTMNRAFREPLVQTQRGGAEHGAARLTKTGRAVLGLYREMEKKSLSAAAGSWQRLRRHLRG